MNKNTALIVIGATSVIALVSVVSAISLSSKNKMANAEIFALQEQIVRMEAFVPDASPEPEIVYLTSDGDTNKLTVLKTQLAEKEAVIESIQSKTNRPPRQRESFEERMARMKKEEPETYAEMIKKREERSNQMRYDLAERTATFMDLDTSTMTEEELANHELLVTKMAKVWELTEKFQDPEAAPDREAMREMMTEMKEVRPLLKEERTTMFKQLGTSLGYKGEDADNFASHIEEIIGTTSIKMPRGGRRGDRGGDGR